jgi:hypothetical protein
MHLSQLLACEISFGFILEIPVLTTMVGSDNELVKIVLLFFITTTHSYAHQ